MISCRLNKTTVKPYMLLIVSYADMLNADDDAHYDENSARDAGDDDKDADDY